MAYQPTTNFGWAMPRGGDQAQISVINQQFTAKADEIVYQTRRMIAPGYIDDGTKTYHEGEIVEYENVDYVCTGTTSGAWDSSKWDSTDMATQIQEAKESGGTNVEANPVEAATADLHKLKVDTTVYGIPDPTVTKTATGNPIEITDGADAPLVKCVTQITGSQDLHGYDKPWVGGAGKNKLPFFTETKTQSGCTVVPNDDGTYHFYGTATSANIIAYELTSFTFSGSYVFTSSVPSSATGSVTLYVEAKSNPGTIIVVNNGDTVNAETHNLLRIAFYFTNGTTRDFSNVALMLRRENETADFQPYSNICPITAYTEGEIEVRGKNIALFSNGTQMQESAQSVSFTDDGVVFTANGTYSRSLYKLELEPLVLGKKYTISFKGKSTGDYNNIYFGSENVLRSSDYGYNHLTSTETEYKITFTAVSKDLYTTAYVTSSASSGVMTISEFQIESGQVKTEFEPYTSTTHTTTYPSAIYRGSEDCVNGTATTEWGMIASYAGETLPGEWISDRDEYVPGTTPTTGAQVAYELTTPTTSSVTPTNLPIKSLSGYTHIESSTGDMEVEYITQGYQPIVDLIDEAADTKHAYSTTEHVVGKWVDGETDVFEKEIITEFNNAAPQYTLDLSSIGGVSTMPIFVSHSVLDAMEGSTPIKQITMPAATNSTYSSISVQHQSSAVTGKAYITVRYIKTSSNNRSLSKGAMDSLKADLSEEKNESEESVDKVDKVDEPTETIEEKEENAGESNSENER